MKITGHYSEAVFYDATECEHCGALDKIPADLSGSPQKDPATLYCNCCGKNSAGLTAPTIKTLYVDFKVGERVTIAPINTKGTIREITICNRGVLYTTAFWLNGDYKLLSLEPDQLTPAE